MGDWWLAWALGVVSVEFDRLMADYHAWAVRRVVSGHTLDSVASVGARLCDLEIRMGMALTALFIGIRY